MKRRESGSSGDVGVVAFVAGATGYTGREVVSALADREGVRVVAHVRPDSSRVAHWTSTFTSEGAEVDTTAWELQALTNTLQRLAPTHVFSLLGTTARRAGQEGMQASDAYRKVDYGLTALLIDAAATCEVPPRFVYLSAAGVREGTSNPYMRARVDAEAHLRESGLPFTIVRPSFISGPDRDERRIAERVGASVADKALAVAGALGAHKLRDRYASMTGAELASRMVRVALDPACEHAIVHGEGLRRTDPER